MAPDTVLLDTDFRITALSPGADAWLGADALGRTLADLLPASVDAACAAIGGGTPSAQDLTRGGRTRRVTARPLVGSGGVVLTLEAVGGEGDHTDAEFRALVEASAQIVWRTDAEGRSIGHSPTWCAYTGQTREEWLGDGWIDVVHPEDRPPLYEIWKASVEAEGGYQAEFRVHHAASGSWRWMAARAAPIRTADGTFDGHVGMNVDVTARRAAAEALRASEQRFRAIAETLPGILYTIAPTGEVSYVNAQFEAMTGIDPTTLTASGDWARTVHPEDVPAVTVACAEAFADRSHVELRYRLASAEGGHRWTLTRARAVMHPGGTFAGWFGTTADIDDLVQAEQALLRANESLEARVEAGTARVRQLAAALAVAEQSERRRIAQVLHDDLQQQLYSASIMLSTVQQQTVGLGHAALLDRCAQILDEATALGRTLTTDLSPTVLESDDACAIVEYLAQESRTRHGLAVEVRAEGSCTVADLATRSLVYRSLREVLFNVVKHAEARHVEITVSLVDGRLTITVEDDGHGFDTATMADGFGLTSVRDRLMLVGGALDIASAPGQGTRVHMGMPISSPSVEP